MAKPFRFRPMGLPDEEENVESTSDAQTGAIDTQAPEAMPDNYQGLADLAREIEPSLKESDNLPKQAPVAPGTERGPDGKFLPRKDALAVGATGPEGEGATGAAAPSGTGEQTGSTGATGPASRDADLEVKPDLQVRPSTRKVIEGYQQKAVEARNERDTAAAKLTDLQKRLEETETKLKTIKAPKEMEEELITLRSRVRELDISKDPAIQQKYDAKIKRNGETAIGLLKDNGLFMLAQKDGPAKEMTEAEKKSLTAEIERGGFGIRGMARYISALEKAGEYESAERLRHVAAENDRLGQEKEEEISTWNKDYEGFQASRTRETQETQQKYISEVQKAGAVELEAGLADLSKRFPFLARPPEILPSDSAEVKVSKQKALDEHQKGVESLNAASKEFNTDGLPPEKAALAYGKMQASAVQAVIIKQQLLPRLEKRMAESAARVKELETELAKLRKAGTLNRAHSAAITTPSPNGKAPSSELSLVDAAKQVAQEIGIKID